MTTTWDGNSAGLQGWHATTYVSGQLCLVRSNARIPDLTQSHWTCALSTLSKYVYGLDRDSGCQREEAPIIWMHLHMEASHLATGKHLLVQTRQWQWAEEYVVSAQPLSDTLN